MSRVAVVGAGYVGVTTAACLAQLGDHVRAETDPVRLALVTNVLWNTTISDMETCYKLFDRRLLESIEWRSDRLGFEPEVTAKLCRKGERIYEVPISYTGRELDEGKKITWKDGAEALWVLIRCRLARR